jgi:protoporphyrinogen IX oxidase
VLRTTNPGVMDKLGTLLVWLHLSGNIVWIGSILAVGAILTGSMGTQKLRGEIALRVYLRLAVPAFVVSFVCGASRMSMNTSYYLVEHHWMHPKLLAAVAAIGLHHVIGARAKAAAKAGDPPAPGEQARGTVHEGRSTAMLSVVLAATAVLAAFFAIFRIPA